MLVFCCYCCFFTQRVSAVSNPLCDLVVHQTLDAWKSWQLKSRLVVERRSIISLRSRRGFAFHRLPSASVALDLPSLLSYLPLRQVSQSVVAFAWRYECQCVWVCPPVLTSRVNHFGLRDCAESDSALSNSAGFAQRRFLESPMWHCSGHWTGVVPSAEMSSLNACEILWLWSWLTWHKNSQVSVHVRIWAVRFGVC